MDTVVSRRPYCDVMAVPAPDDSFPYQMDVTYAGYKLLRRAGILGSGKSSDDEGRNKKRDKYQGRDGSDRDSANKDSELNNNKIMGNLDPNVYATKKTIAQGLLDVALLTANASQLKYLLQVGKEHEFYHVMMVLISFSIILQIAIGAVAILKSRRNINEEAQQDSANFFNNLQVWLAFLATVVHVFLSVFTITPEVQEPMTDDVVYSTTEAPPNGAGT